MFEVWISVWIILGCLSVGGVVLSLVGLSEARNEEKRKKDAQSALGFIVLIFVSAAWPVLLPLLASWGMMKLYRIAKDG